LVYPRLQRLKALKMSTVVFWILRLPFLVGGYERFTYPEEKKVSPPFYLS
jgi:hypothetical protein